MPSRHTAFTAGPMTVGRLASITRTPRFCDLVRLGVGRVGKPCPHRSHDTCRGRRRPRAAKVLYGCKRTERKRDWIRRYDLRVERGPGSLPALRIRW